MASSSNEVTNNLTEDTYHQLRDKYRQLTADMQQMADSAGTGGIDIESVKHNLLAANDAFIQVKRPREAVLDGKYMKLITQIAKTNIEASQASLMKFNASEFADKIKAFMIPSGRIDDLNKNGPWIKLGKEASFCIEKRAHGFEPMLVALETNFLQTVQRRAPRKPEASETIAKKLTQTESLTSEEAQTEEVSRVFKVLRRRFKENRGQPLCFFTFVTNPNSFTLTIENIFHVAFLLNDGYANITEDENKLPIIAPIVGGGASSNEEVAKQCIVSLNIEEWKEIIEVFGIAAPMIPPPARENKRSLDQTS